MLTEAEVHRSFNTIFKNEGRTPEAFDKAEQLLEQLRGKPASASAVGGTGRAAETAQEEEVGRAVKGGERRQRFCADAARTRIAFPCRWPPD